MSKKPEIPKTNVPEQTPFQIEMEKMRELFWKEVEEKNLSGEAVEEARLKYHAIMLKKFPVEMQAEVDAENASKDFVDDVLRGVKEQTEEEENQMGAMDSTALISAMVTPLISKIFEPKPEIPCPAGFKRKKQRKIKTVKFAVELGY